MATDPDNDPEIAIVSVPAESRTPADIIRFLISHSKLNFKHCPEEEAALLARVLHREELGSTHCGTGLAAPHAPSDACPRTIAVIGRLPVPISWDHDNRTVRFVALIVWPSAGSSRLRLQSLEAVTRALKEHNLR